MPPPPTKKEHCYRCKLVFNDWDTFHGHLIESDRHHACYVCAQEFHNQAALDSHYKQNHAHKQNLRCVRCFKRFTTLGGLTAHIEFDESACYSGLNLTAKVHETTARDRLMDAARNFKGGRAGGNIVPEDEPRPALRDWSQVAPPVNTLQNASGNAVNLGSRPVSSNNNNSPAQKAAPVETLKVSPWGAPTANTGVLPNAFQPVRVTFPTVTIGEASFPLLPDLESSGSVFKFEDGDLLSYDDPSRIMNQPWDDCLPPSLDAFPVLPLASFKNPLSTPNIIDTPAPLKTVWVKQQPRAPVPAAVTTPAQLANKLNSWHVDQTDEPAMSPWDPENPTFRAEHYLNEITKKYRCPHPGCKKYAIPSKSAFIQHLRSIAHKNERLQCHGCLRYFDSATALAQHASAQGVRCRVRESDNYDNEVDRFTAGHAAPDGRFDDDTIKYIATGMPQTAQGLVDAHRAAQAERAEQIETYWNKYEPRW